MGSGRTLGFLLLVLLAAGIAVALNLYADDEAQKIVAGAPEASPEDDAVDAERCERAQIEFETLWDASIENPEDPTYEERLEIALSEVNSACGIE